MIRKTAAAVLLLALFAPLQGVTVAEKGSSPYQIVIPEKCGEKLMDHYIALGAKMLRTAIQKASGARLPLVTESKMIPGKPAIFVGSCKGTAKAGIDAAGLKPWEHIIKVSGKDIYICGRDIPSPFKKNKRMLHYTMGTLKGACVFAEKFLNTRFVGIHMNSSTENDGVRTRPLARITVPDNFSYRALPRFTVMGEQGGALYCAANNFVFSCGEKYDVHYMENILPAAKTLKTDPEYFAIINGRRYTRTDMPQYCMSHPEVQKKVLEEALRRADAGWKVIEVGQTDGFIGCECARCKAWYNTPDWSEKMWCFHRDTVAKLQKARPGIKTGIACYGVTHSVPKSFSRFPGEGVVINIAPATRQLLEKWKKFNVIGMNAWAYNMGAYHASGYSPAECFRDLQKSVRLLKDSPITSLYLCQFTTSYAINGPWHYAYGKLLGDTEVRFDKLLAEYCLFAFGEKAAPIFTKFFTIIDKQMEKFPLDDTQDFNDVDGKKPRQSAIKLWQNRYPEGVLKELRALFAEGIRKCDPANSMLPRLKLEFEYLCLSAEACNAAKALEKENTFANRCRLADALEKRNKFIEARKTRKDGFILDAFYVRGLNKVKRGGFMAGIFGGVFESDPKLLRLNAPEAAAVKVKDFNDPAWSKAPVQSFKTLMGKKESKCTVRLGYASRGILVKMSVPTEGLALEKRLANVRDDTKMWDDAVWEIFIADGGCIRQFAFNGAKGSVYDETVYPSGARSRRWTANWQVSESVKNGIWESRVFIPWRASGLKFREGLRCKMQFAFTPSRKAIFCWHLPLSGALNDISGFGGVRFGERPAKRNIDVNGEFKRLDKKGLPVNWSTKKLDMKLIKRAKNTSLEVSGEVKSFDAAYNSTPIQVEPDEELVVTAKVRGKGTLNFFLSWRDNTGRWVSNMEGGKLPLTEKGTEKRWRISSGHLVQKDAAAVTFSFYLLRPGGKLIIDSVKAEVVRKKK